MAEKTHISDADRRYLKILEEQDGVATTNQLREKGGFTSDQITYRHNKMERQGLVEIEKDNSLTPPDVSPMKVAHLTEKGEALIAQGEAAEAEIDATTEERLDRLENDIDELIDTMDGAFPWMREFAARVHRLEDAFEQTSGVELDEFADVNEYQNGGD